MYLELNFDEVTRKDNTKLEPFTGSERVLVLEDDLTFKPLWTAVIKHVCPHANIDWVQTEEAAERFIKVRHKLGQSYQLVITDIFLLGRKTGIDLWERFGQSIENFIFVSSLPREKFDTLVSSSEHSYPVYLQKPLRASICAEVIRELVGTTK